MLLKGLPLSKLFTLPIQIKRKQNLDVHTKARHKNSVTCMFFDLQKPIIQVYTAN